MRSALCTYTPVASHYLNLSLEDMMSEVQLTRLQAQDRDKLVPRTLSFTSENQKGEKKPKLKGSSFGRSKMSDILARYPDFAPTANKQSLPLRALANETRPNLLKEYYYPKLQRVKREGDRPGMMALTLEPKVHPWIDRNSKDVWDYVLRRMFVMQGSTIEVAVK
jgi:hypothetical protein